MRKFLLNVRKCITLAYLVLIITMMIILCFSIALGVAGYEYFSDFDFSSFSAVMGSIVTLVVLYANAVWIVIIVSVFFVTGYYIYYLVRRAAAKTQSAAWIVVCILAQLALMFLMTDGSDVNPIYWVGIALDLIALCLPKKS